MSSSVSLLKLYDDIFTYVLSFLNGKDLGKLESVCKRMTQSNIVENAARRQFWGRHPNLPQELLQQHMKYTNMISTTFKYMWYISTKKVPKVQDVSKRYTQVTSRTNYDLSGHMRYMMEKVFCCGNIVVLLSFLRFLKKYISFNSNNEDHIAYFCRFFVKLGSQVIGDMYQFNPDLIEEFQPNDVQIRFQMNTLLYLLRNHRDLLYLGDYYKAFVHLFMMECCDRGLVDLAIEFRRMECPIRPPLDVEYKWKHFFTEILKYPYYTDYMWIDVKDPCVVQDLQMQRKLDARIAILKINEVEEHEKLSELEIITANVYYGHRQMVDFMKELLKLNAVSLVIKYRAEQWVEGNDVY